MPGTVFGGYSGDGGPATSAELNGPDGAAVDGAGNLYIADTGNCRIRKVDDLTGIITTVAGNGTCGYNGDGGPASNAELSGPWGVALDAAGNLYILDPGNDRIRKVDASTGIITTCAGGGPGGVSDGDGGPATSATFSLPEGIASDATGNLYIADTFNDRIRKVDAVTGIITTVAGNGDTDLGYSGDGGPALSAGLDYPAGVAVDIAGNIYIADKDSNRVREVDAATGVINTVAGNSGLGFDGDGVPATSTSLWGPISVALDTSGNIYIADLEDMRIRFVDAATGIINTIAGNGIAGYGGDGGLATAAFINRAFGVTLDTSGNLYIADTDNDRVRIVRPQALPATTTTLTAVPTTLNYGQSLALTATVTAASGGTPSGTVSFLSGTISLGSGTLNSSGVATLTLTPGAGSYSITASYSGSTTDGPSQSAPPVVVTVIGIATTTTLSASATSLTAGQALTLTATVTAASGGTPTGTVTFYNGASSLGSGSLNSNGVATLALTPAAGSYTITASFAGSSSDNASVSSPPVTVTVNPGATTTTTLAVTSGGNAVTSVAPGTPIMLTATVMAGGTPVSPGQVNFCDAAAKYCTDIHVLGMKQLIQSGPGLGTAALTFYPVAGVHSFKAVFLGTTTNAGSSSSPSSLTVTGNYPTTTTIAQSGGPGNYTLTATVTGQNNLPPAGLVSFLDTTNANYPLATAELTPVTGPSGLDFLNSWDLTSDTTLWNGFPSSVVEVRVITGDFNGDGKLDLAVLWFQYTNCNAKVCPAESELDILLGNGDGTFAAAPPAVPLKEGLYVSDFVAGDFNGDGREDLVLLLGDPNDNLIPAASFQVLLGKGDGTFTSLPPFPTPASTYGGSLAAGDFNGDGKLDLIVGDLVQLGPNSQGLIRDDLYIVTLLGNGDGTFQSPWTSPLLLFDVDIYISNFALADFNGDGNLDLAMGTDYDTVIVMQGNGDGTFTQLAQAPATGDAPLALAVADFNGDGIPDLATANAGDNTVTILLGNGDGTFTAAPVSPPTGPIPGTIAAGNFSKYGTADLAIANFENSATLLLGNGDETFGGLLDIPAGASPVSIVVGDFTGNGLSDWAVAEVAANGASPPDVDVFVDQFTGFTSTATATGISPVGTGTHLVDASYPGNSIYSGSLSATTPLVAERVATTLTVTATLTGSPGTGQLLLTATVNPSLAQGHTPTGAITFSSGSTNLGSGTISNGVATLTVSGLPPGAESITAVYPGDANFAGSTSSAAIITVDFSISASPASQTVYTGLAASYTVTVTPGAGFNLPVALSCSQLPANTTCHFSPASVNGGSWSSTLVVQTSAPSPAATASVFSKRIPFAALAGLFLLFIPRRRRRRNIWPMGLLIFAALFAGIAIAGCAAPGSLTGGTPVGSQTVTVTGTATNGPQTLTHATTVTLNVNSLF